MRYLKYSLLIIILLIPVAIGVGAILTIQGKPLISSRVQLKHQDIDRAKKILRQHDPRKLNKGEVRTLSISESDLNRAGNYVLARLSRARFKAVMEPGKILVQGTLALPKNPMGQYVNVEALLLESGSVPNIEQIQIGSLPIPGFVAKMGFAFAVNVLEMRKEVGLLQDTLRNVTMSKNRMRVTYSWNPDIVKVARAHILSEKNQKLIHIYQSHLSKVTRVFRSGQNVSLTKIMIPMFKFAQDRSKSGQPFDENKAVITVLAAYVNDLSLSKLSPSVEKIKKPKSLLVTLGGRKDLAQHFITSSAIAFAGGSGLSNAVGIFKEISDSRGGSGFSFADLAADLAGTRFGKQSTGGQQLAIQVQARLSKSVNEKFIFPDIKGLPEAMDEKDFHRRFGGIDSPAYLQMTSNIKARIDRCGLYLR